jgi:hypothetical protein
LKLLRANSRSNVNLTVRLRTIIYTFEAGNCAIQGV